MQAGTLYVPGAALPERTTIFPVASSYAALSPDTLSTVMLLKLCLIICT